MRGFSAASEERGSTSNRLANPEVREAADQFAKFPQIDSNGGAAHREGVIHADF